jgi:hypothetical protein
MIITAFLPLLLVTLASAGPIAARDQEEEGLGELYSLNIGGMRS